MVDVTLSGSIQAVTLLRSLRTLTSQSTLLFPGERDRQKSMSNNTILGALDRSDLRGAHDGPRPLKRCLHTPPHEKNRPYEHIKLS